MESALLVAVFTRRSQRETTAQNLDELRELAASAGAEVRDAVMQFRPQLDPAYLIGRGKAEELATRVQEEKIDMVIFDDTLSPAQQRNLEGLMQRKVVDRTALILDIFAQRARTREGKLQVQLAQLNYMLPRLTGGSDFLSRLGGGIGTRGPGETKLEMDRRRIRTQIARARSEIEKVRKHRRLHRAQRQGVPVPVVTLVGYTNAGKSTLFTALTRAKTLQSSRMFATLDPLVRRLRLPASGDVLLTDTVGFVRKLPHDLIAAFRATLEEIGEADLLLHVVDRSQDNYRDQIRAVDDVLKELGFTSVPVVMVFNKVDLLAEAPPARTDDTGAVFVSALTGRGLEDLQAEIDRRFRERLPPRDDPAAGQS